MEILCLSFLLCFTIQLFPATHCEDTSQSDHASAKTDLVRNNARFFNGNTDKTGECLVQLMKQRGDIALMNDKMNKYDHDRIAMMEILKNQQRDIDFLKRENSALQLLSEEQSDRIEHLVEATRELKRTNEIQALQIDRLFKEIGKPSVSEVDKNSKTGEPENATIARGEGLTDTNTTRKAENIPPSLKTRGDFARSAKQPRQVLVGVRKVAFTAVISPAELDNLGPGETIIFDKVITNIGNAYHSHTGVFIAPISGTYVFNVGAMSRPGNQEYTALYLNGVRMMEIYTDARGRADYEYESSSRTAVLEVTAGDRIYVEAVSGANAIHGNSHSTFSGWLLYEA